jgi:anthranilate synthase component 1
VVVSVAPDEKLFLKLAAEYPGKLIPVTRSFLADGLTPVAAYRRMAVGDYGFLLESVERGDRIGRYSFVGSAPDAIFRGRVFPAPSYAFDTPAEKGAYRDGDPLLSRAPTFPCRRSRAEPSAFSATTWSA